MNEKKVKQMRKFARSICKNEPHKYEAVYRAIKKGQREKDRMAGFIPTTNKSSQRTQSMENRNDLDN